MSKPSDRPSGRVEHISPLPAQTTPSDNGSLPPDQSSVTPGSRVTSAFVSQLAEQLSQRDLVILGDLARVRCLTGNQLERLHLSDLAAPNRSRARRRVLGRLIRSQAVTTLARRIGGVRAGSAGLVYALDVAGQRVVRLTDGHNELPARRPWTQGALFLAHTLAVSELYVQLREAEAAGLVELLEFLAEPAAWQRTTALGTLKPDAYLLIAGGEFEDAWWIEVDLATESRATLRRKLNLYLLAAQAGVTGPHKMLPRVLVTVPDLRRLAVVRELLAELPPLVKRLILVTLHNQAVAFMVRSLRE
jgi:hypothetical protein